MFKLRNYKTLVFDCDGVVLNSNKIKTHAFYEGVKHFGHQQAQALVDYHITNGGISRYVKFEYFINQILLQPFDAILYQDLLKRYSKGLKNGLMNCEIVEGLDHLKMQSPNANWLIVSGGNQEELRDVFYQRNLEKYFDGGIFGSPDTKDIILARELKNGNIKRPALFFGDSKYDSQAAKTAALDFVFISQWTEVKDHHVWCQKEQICSKLNLAEF